jgi:hypothetical protein
MRGFQPGVSKSQGKPSQQQLLPNRHAMNVITKGNPQERSLSNYAKLTPSGMAGMMKTYPAIMEEGQEGASPKP